MGTDRSGATEGRNGSALERAGRAARARVEEAWARRRHDARGALRMAEELRDEALAAGDDVALGRALLVVGSCHVLLNDYLAALRALREAVWLLRDGPEADHARALAESGDLDRRLGHYADAVDQLYDALKRYEQLEDQRGQADTLTRLGVVFFHHDAMDEAEHAYERSLALRQELGDLVGVAGIRNNLAKVCTARGQHDAALGHLTEACRGFEAAHERRGVGMALHNTAVVLEELGRCAGAELYLGAAIALYDAAGHPHGAAEARTRLGRLLARRGETARALELAQRAHEEAEALGLHEECVRAAEALADLLEARGEAAEALEWLRHVRAVERGLFDEASEERLRSLQVRFQLERLDRDSVTDALTGLLNRRGLDRALHDRINRAWAEGDDLALLMLDLDDFKRVNDTYSHGTGDEVLRVFAKLLREGTRPTDVRARYGGEEFVVILPACDLERARSVGEKLRDRVHAHGWGAVAEGLNVTTSVGAAVLSEVADADALLAAADRALYEAKHAGKDRVRTA